MSVSSAAVFPEWHPEMAVSHGVAVWQATTWHHTGVLVSQKECGAFRTVF